MAVLLAAFRIARRVEAVRVGEDLGHPVRDRRRHRHELARRHREAVVLEVVDDLAHQDDQRRVQSQRLLDAGLELRDLAQRLVAHLAPVGVERVDLPAHPLHRARVAQQLDQRPGRRARRGVVAREHHRDEHPGDLVDRVARRAVGVADPEQHVEELALDVRALRAAFEHLGEQRDEPRACPVALAEHRQRQVRVHVRDRVGALLELVEDAVVLRGELLAELTPDQARARGVERELGEEVEQIDLAALADAVHHAARLRRDRLRVRAHHLVAQRLVAHRLAALLGRAVEHHAAAEDRRHERIGCGLVVLLLLGAEERLLRGLAREQHDARAGPVHLADLAALVAHAPEQLDRAAAQVEQMAEQRQSAGEPRRRPGAARARGRDVTVDQRRGLIHGLRSPPGRCAKLAVMVRPSRAARQIRAR